MSHFSAAQRRHGKIGQNDGQQNHFFRDMGEEFGSR
jgi:hypothetical protein